MDLYKIGKRILDIFGSICGIILFSPFLIGGSIWVKLVSPEGPVMADIKPRVGRGRKHFKLLKFRSMVPDGYNFLKNNYPDLHKKYEENNYKLDADEDPRLLPGAKFMRKFSIDEMPQVFNILKGEMSLVGPRAYYFYELDEQVERFPESKEYIDAALSVKPGLTGLWQVSGRSDVGFMQRIKLDAEYAEKRSLMYDLVIILKTPFVVLSGRGAA